MADETRALSSDPFLQLLTDALRDGPGSPKWHEAIRTLNEMQSGSASVDEYRLLVQAREHLESGREFRSIRPGPAFTRGVMNAIDNNRNVSGKPSGLQWLLIVCISLIAVCVISLAAWIMPHASADQTELAVLSQTIFGRPLLTLDVDNPPSEVNSQWHIIGNLPLTFHRGIEAERVAPLAPLPVGGGVANVAPLLPRNAFDVDVKLRLTGDGDDLVPEIAVSDADAFSTPMASSPHELVWALQGRQAKVILPDGRLTAQTDIGAGNREVNIRIKVGQHVAIVEIDGRAMWSGVSQLAGDQKRLFVAVRLIRRGRGDRNNVIIRSVGVLAAR